MLGIRSKVVIVVRDEEKDRKIEGKGNTLVKNFLAIYEQIFTRKLSGSRALFVDIGGSVRALNDQYYVLTDRYAPCIALGSGTTPVSFNDYNLENIVVGWSQVQGYEVNYDDTYFKGTFKAYKPFTFTEETTINEAGLAWWICDASGNSHLTMVDRIVLDTPITVPANRTIDVYYILEIGKA